MLISICLGLFFGVLLGLLVCNLPRIDSANVSVWYFEDSPASLQAILPPPKSIGLFSLPVDCSDCGKKISLTSLLPLIGLYKLLGKCKGYCFSLYLKLVIVQFVTVGVFVLSMPIDLYDNTALLLLILSCCLVVALFIDMDFRYVPEGLLSIIMITSVGLMVDGHASHLAEHFYLFVSIILGLRLLNLGKTRLGTADISIIASFSLFLELEYLLELVYLAFIFAAVQFLVVWVKSSKSAHVPFVPALFFSFLFVYYFDIKVFTYLLY